MVINKSKMGLEACLTDSYIAKEFSRY